MRQRMIRCCGDLERVCDCGRRWFVLAPVLLMILTSDVAAGGRRVAGSLDDEWAIASARYDAAVSRMQAIECDREEARVVIHDIAPELTAGIGGVITSRNARIAGDRVRVLLVLTELNDTPGWSRESWYSFDGKHVRQWSREWKDGVPMVCSGSIGPSGHGVAGRMRSEMTPFRLVGDHLRGGDESLRQLMQDSPVDVRRETVDGHRCITAVFTCDAYPMEGSPVQTITVSLDESVDCLPRRIHCLVESFSLPGKGEIPSTEDLIEITGFTSVTDADLNTEVLVPSQAPRIHPAGTTEFSFRNIQLNRSLPAGSFLPEFPFGCRVQDNSRRESVVRFIGGENGQREWMIKSGISNQTIDMVMDGPKPGALMDSASSGASLSANNVTRRSARPDSGTSVTTRLVLILVTAGCFLGAFASWRLRA